MLPPDESVAIHGPLNPLACPSHEPVAIARGHHGSLALLAKDILKHKSVSPLPVAPAAARVIAAHRHLVDDDAGFVVEVSTLHALANFGSLDKIGLRYPRFHHQ